MNINAIREKCEHDPVFLANLCESETEEELIQLCQKNNLDISRDEAADLLKGFEKAKAYENSEEALSEEDLDAVSGGLVISTTTIVLAGIGIYAAYDAGKKLGKWVGSKRCKWFGY